MPRTSKSSYPNKQKRHAEHVETTARAAASSQREAEHRAGPEFRGEHSGQARAARDDIDDKVELRSEDGPQRNGRKRHRGLGRQGLSPDERLEPAGDEQGLGREGTAGRHDYRKAPVKTSAFTDKLPQWLKSLHEMENELRDAARKGLILRKEAASEHLAKARQHLQSALDEARDIEPPNGPQTRLRKEGEV